MIQQRKNGFSEVILIAGCNVDILYATMDWLKKRIGIVFYEAYERNGRVSHKFIYSDAVFVIFYDPLAGISLYPENRENATENDNEAFDRFIKILKSF